MDKSSEVIFRNCDNLALYETLHSHQSFSINYNLMFFTAVSLVQSGLFNSTFPTN